MLGLRYNTKSVRDILVLCCYHTNTKYVNNARSGKLNFEKDFNASHIDTSPFQKFLLGLGSGFMSITDPRRGDMVAVMGESTGTSALEYIQSKMLQSEEGRHILEEKPRISSASVDLEKLKHFPEGTLGKAYSNFLERYKYSPDERLAVRFVDDFELAYVAQRYREAHDLFHTILDMPTNMLGEVAVKWVEAIQTKLPMCVTGALFGPLRLAPKLTRTYSTKSVIDLDEDILEDMKINKMKPKKHPGKVGGYVILPEKLENRIIKHLERNEVLHLHNKVRKDKIRLYRKILPLEGLRRDTLISNVRRIKLEKLLSSEEVFTKDKLQKILNETVKRYEKTLNKMAEQVVFDKNTSLMYLMTRASYEYATVYRIFQELSKKDPCFAPKTLFDFGSGMGTVTWAASEIWKNSIMEYFTVDMSTEMNELALSIIQPDPSKPPLVKGFLQRQFLPASTMDFDIVVSAFGFSYLRNFQDRMDKLNSLWNKTSQYLVLVENGTKDGFSVITEAREMILQQSSSLGFKCHILAPCPHDLVCPRTADTCKKPCNFLSKYRELKFGKTENFEQTPYSYVIFKKGSRPDTDRRWPRVVEEVLNRQKHIVCQFCTSDGKLERVTVSKSRYEHITYRCSRCLSWGDCFPGKLSYVKCPSTKSEGNFSDNDETSYSSSDDEDCNDELSKNY